MMDILSDFLFYIPVILILILLFSKICEKKDITKDMEN